MKARQSALLDTARRVQAFLDANATVVGPNITSARRNFDAAVTKLTTMSVTQTGGVIASRGATAQQRALRANLRHANMKPITQVAKLMLPNVPEINQLAVPTQDLSGAALVSAAHAMADAAEKYESTFIANGLPDTFVADLRAAADAVTTSATGRELTNATTTGAVQGMMAQESRVRTLLKVLNALVVPKLGTDASLLQAWKVARAIDHQKPVKPVPSSVASATGSAASASAGTTAVTPSTTAASASTTEPTATASASPPLAAAA